MYHVFRRLINFKTGAQPEQVIGSYKTLTVALASCENDIKEEKDYDVSSSTCIYKGGSKVIGCFVSDEQGITVILYRVVLYKPEIPNYTLFKNDEILNHYDSVEEAINYLNTIVPSTKLHNALNILTEKENLDNSPLYNDTKPILTFKGSDSKHHYDFRIDFYFLYKN